MSSVHYFNRASVGQTNLYVVLFQGDDVANGGGFTSIAAGFSNAIIRANAITLSDTPHPGLYYGDIPGGTPPSRYIPIVFQSSGNPATTAATTDPVISRLETLDWDGQALLGFADVGTSSTGTGSGAFPVDHDGGSGVTVDGVASAPDILRYLGTDLAGRDGLFVAAYLASEWDSVPTVRSPKGTTQTGPDGRWVAPLMLDSGTYYLIADDQGDSYEAQLNTLVVP